MSAVGMATAAGSRTASTIWPLARIEATRYARHPLFLVGFVLGVATSVIGAGAGAGGFGPIELGYQVYPAFFLGIFGIVVGARLTTSTHRSRPIVDAAPVSETMRTAALVLGCLVPAGAGVLLVVVHRIHVLANPIPDWQYGTFGPADRFAITMIIPVIASAGGPLLGVAVGRWFRFPASALLVVTAVLAWSSVAAYLPDQNWLTSSSLLARVLHMVTPYTAYGQRDDPGSTHPAHFVQSYSGSPTWFAVWTLALCGLAAAAALRRNSAGTTRRVLAWTFAALAVMALLALILSIATGNQRLYNTSPHGTVPAAAAPSGG